MPPARRRNTRSARLRKPHDSTPRRSHDASDTASHQRTEDDTPSSHPCQLSQPATANIIKQGTKDIIMHDPVPPREDGLGHTRKRKHREEIPDSDSDAEEIQFVKRTYRAQPDACLLAQDKITLPYSPEIAHSTSTTSIPQTDVALDEVKKTTGQSLLHPRPVFHGTTSPPCTKYDTEFNPDMAHTRPYQCNPRRYYRELVAESVRQTSTTGKD